MCLVRLPIKNKMLVLSRKKNESIMIDDDIEVIVVAIRGYTVRLGIKCPPNIPVHRKEVHDAIRKNLKAFGESKEPKKPEYVNSRHYNIMLSCPNLDSPTDIDSKLERMYNF